MSEGPRKYHLNHEAANELEEQAKKAAPLLAEFAAQIAATELLDGRPSDLVLAEHVRKAAEVLFRIPSVTAQVKPIFLSCSRGDGPFIEELKAKLDRQGLAYFESKRIK